MQSTAQSPVLLARGLGKAYGKRSVLRDVDLTLYPGKLVALLGANGAGKSTLLQILSGLFVPDAGELSILGHNMANAAPHALAQLGVVFQQISLDLDLSVQANLLFHADLHGLPRRIALERIAEGLGSHGLTQQAQLPARALSGGNRRKVELIRALLHRPRFLLMDEATVGLDPASRQSLMAAVLDLVRAQSVAVLWATHLVDEVAHADQIVVLQQGSVAFTGGPAELLSTTQCHTLEAAFLKLCEGAGMAQAPIGGGGL
jgi:ABC-2 type transport system ATP-binding protein